MALDAEFPAFCGALPEAGSMQTHLLGTFGVLHNWHQPRAHCRAGLFHTAYMAPGSIPYGAAGDGGDGGTELDRAALQVAIGPEAEQLVALFSSDALSWEKLATTSLIGVPPESAVLPCGAHRPVSRTEFAQLAILAVADIAECAHEALPEDGGGMVSDSAATPCNDAMKPAVEMYWMSQLCEQLREDLICVPPIFDGCTRSITRDAELQARDAYWFAVQHQAQHGGGEKSVLGALQDAVALNPFTAEPHVLMSQILMQHGCWGEAAEHAKLALHLFYQWGTAWDKRAPFSRWVAFAATSAMRSVAGKQCSSELPLVASTVLPLPEYVAFLNLGPTRTASF